MQTTFRLTNPDELSAQSLKYLNDAIKASPGMVGSYDVWFILDFARAGKCEIYEVWSDKLLGAFCLEFVDTTLNIPLLGGDNFDDWKGDLVTWGEQVMIDRGVKNVLVMGRPAWRREFGKMFKKLRPVGILFEH